MSKPFEEQVECDGCGMSIDDQSRCGNPACPKNEPMRRRPYQTPAIESTSTLSAGAGPAPFRCCASPDEMELALGGQVPTFSWVNRLLAGEEESLSLIACRRCGVVTVRPTGQVFRSPVHLPPGIERVLGGGMAALVGGRESEETPLDDLHEGVSVYEGKYTFSIEPGDYRVQCKRNGEDWVVFEQGCRAVLAVVMELVAARERVKELEARLAAGPEKDWRRTEGRRGED